jgi:hypothetical protein
MDIDSQVYPAVWLSAPRPAGASRVGGRFVPVPVGLPLTPNLHSPALIMCSLA